MKLFSKSSIKRKLIAMIMLATGLTLVVASMIMALYDFAKFREWEASEVNAIANVISANSAASLLFEDSEAAQETLEALRANPKITNAVLYNLKDVVAEYRRDPAGPPPLPFRGMGTFFEHNRLVHFQPVTLENKWIGTLQIESGLDFERDRLRQQILIMLAVFVVAMLSAYLIAAKIQAMISHPIGSLVEATERVSSENNYALQVPRQGDDELGQLVDHFNSMLRQIQLRDHALITARDNLEVRVQERTAELEVVNHKLQVELLERQRVEDVLKAQNQVLEQVAKGHRLDDMMLTLCRFLESQMDRMYCAVLILEEKKEVLRVLAAPTLPKRYAEILNEVRVDTRENCAAAAAGRNETIIAEDLETSSLEQSHRSLTLAQGIRSSWCQPITDTENKVLGVIALYGTTVRRPTLEELSLLKSSANLAGLAISHIRVEDGLKSYANELTRSNQALEDFAAIASHDLQEPLRKVIAFGDRLRLSLEHNLDERSSNYLDRMLSATERMRKFLEDLLNYSRVSMKAQPFAPVDLGQVVNDVLFDLELRINRTRGKVEVHTLPVVEADAMQMKQLFLNLIGNALKFRKPEEDPIVVISAREITGGFCEIRVRDNGIGFDEIYLDRIFKPFERLHGRSEHEGSGVGLAICEKIVARHGGTLTARSKPQEGTTFIFTLSGKMRG